MPKFTFIKHSEFEGDSEVTMTFAAEMVETTRENFEDFISCSGFVVEAEKEEEDFQFQVFPFEVPKESDWMWGDEEADVQAAQMVEKPFSREDITIFDLQKEEETPIDTLRL